MKSTRLKINVTRQRHKENRNGGKASDWRMESCDDKSHDSVLEESICSAGLCSCLQDDLCI